MTWSLVWALLILIGGCLVIAIVCVFLIVRGDRKRDRQDGPGDAPRVLGPGRHHGDERLATGPDLRRDLED